jgi:hypothetical protein
MAIMTALSCRAEIFSFAAPTAPSGTLLGGFLSQVESEMALGAGNKHIAPLQRKVVRSPAILLLTKPERHALLDFPSR